MYFIDNTATDIVMNLLCCLLLNLLISLLHMNVQNHSTLFRPHGLRIFITILVGQEAEIKKTHHN
jgi:hypothetical protein